MFDAFRPDTLLVLVIKAVIAVARLLVPAVVAIMPVVPPIIPSIDIEIWVLPIMPFMVPSDASLIMAVTKAEDTVILRIFADCDMAAIARP